MNEDLIDTYGTDDLDSIADMVIDNETVPYDEYDDYVDLDFDN